MKKNFIREVRSGNLQMVKKETNRSNNLSSQRPSKYRNSVETTYYVTLHTSTLYRSNKINVNQHEKCLNYVKLLVKLRNQNIKI